MTTTLMVAFVTAGGGVALPLTRDVRSRGRRVVQGEGEGEGGGGVRACAVDVRRCRAPVAQLQMPGGGGERGALPGFRRDGEDAAPRTSFLDEGDVDAGADAASGDDATSRASASVGPNERALRQLRETMERLGVSPDGGGGEGLGGVAERGPIDISSANPAGALAGALGAAVFAAVAWRMLDATVAFAIAHPLDDRVYVVRRLAAVARAALVALFALAAGFSGATSVGLALLAARTAFARLTGEFAPPFDKDRDLHS